MANLIIDGSVLEGGGQILRNSISLSALLRKPITIQKVRNGRRPPGLKNQHRTGILLAAEIASADVTGAKNGSSQVDFVPKHIAAGQYAADPITAGAATLLLQISLPLLLFAPEASTLTLKGGTNATGAPQADYIQHVFLPFARRHFDLNADLDIRRRGYFPKGGGQIDVTITPHMKLTSASVLERGSVTRIGGIAHFAGLPGQIGTRIVDAAVACLAARGFSQDASTPVPVEVVSRREKNENTVGAGSGLVLWAELDGGGIIGGSCVGSKQKGPEDVAKEATEELLRGLDSAACVDEWLQDQIIILMALADGESKVRCGELTLHTRTAIWVAEQLTGARFNVTQQGTNSIISCQGIGYTSPQALAIQ